MKNLWQLIVVDWPRKVVAIFFACLIWYTVHLQLQDFETVTEIPISLAVPPNVALLDSGDLPRAEVKIRGSRRVLNRVESTDIEITVPIPEGVALGTYVVRLRDLHVSVPRGVSVESVKPQTFAVQLDERITVSRPVQVDFAGKLDPNLRREELIVFPKDVDVTGPARLVEQVDVRTEAIELDPAMGFEWDVTANLASRPGIRFDPSQVKVSVKFARIRGSASLDNIPIHVLADPDSEFMLEDFSPPTVKVVVAGPTETTDVLTVDSVRAFIDITDVAKEGIYRRSVNLWINAPDCEPTWIQPDGYEFKIVRQPVATPAQ